MQPTNALNVSTNILPSKEGNITVRLGQTINFTLVSQTNTSAKINIGGQILTSQISTPLPTNQPLQAVVMQLQPEVKLEIKTTANQQLQNLVSQTLKSILPQQTLMKNEIQQLINLQTLGKLPASVQTQLTSLINSILKINNFINGADVKNAIGNSGIFLENKLTKKQPTLQQDVKANLLKLLNGINASTSEADQLKKSITQLLNKTTIQQIHAIETNAINVELPVLSNNTPVTLKLDIRTKEVNGEKTWEIITNLNLKNGNIVVKSSYSNEQVSFQIWAEQLKLVNKIKDNLDKFKELLEHNNINYKNIFFIQDMPTADKSAKKVALIDIKV